MEERGVHNSKPTVDLRVLDALLESLDGDTQLLAELVTSYIADTPQQIEVLERTLQSSDAHTMARAAHTLKSTSQAFGAKALADACHALNRWAMARGTTGTEAQIQFVKEEFARVQKLLSQRIESTPNS